MADLARVLWICKVEVTLRRFRDIGGVVENDPRTLAKTEPLVVAVLQVGGNAGFQNVTVDGLQNATVLGAFQTGRINRKQDVCRAVAAFRNHSGDQFVCVSFDAIDGDACGLLEVRIEALVRIVMPRRIQVQLAIRERGRGEHGQDGNRDCRGFSGNWHAGAPWR